MAGRASSLAHLTPIGSEEITAVTLAAGATGLTAAKYSNANGNADVAYIQAEGGDIKYLADGTVPTSTLGMKLADGQQLEYTSDFAALKLIKQSGTPKLNISYYKVS